MTVALILACSLAATGDDRGIRLGEQTTSKWRFGVVVKAAGGAVSGIRATLPVPMDWPEQSVKNIDEQKTPHVDAITYRLLDGGVKQMVVAIPRLAAGEEASAVVTLEIIKRRIEAPSDISVYQLPKPSSQTAARLEAPVRELPHRKGCRAGYRGLPGCRRSETNER